MNPQDEHAKVQAARLETARLAFQQAVDETAREMVGQGAALKLSGRVTLDAGLTAVLRMTHHDGDCQAFQHTYVADQGEPGVFWHDHGMVDVVGTNGRRLLARAEPDGIYVGGALLSNSQALKLAAHLDLMVTRRGGPR